jgi:hypothetical protein
VPTLNPSREVSSTSGGSARLDAVDHQFSEVDKLYQRDQEIRRLQLIAAGEVAAQLRAIGFRVRIVQGDGQLRFPSALGFIARNPTRALAFLRLFYAPRPAIHGPMTSRAETPSQLATVRKLLLTLAKETSR